MSAHFSRCGHRSALTPDSDPPVPLLTRYFGLETKARRHPHGSPARRATSQPVKAREADDREEEEDVEEDTEEAEEAEEAEEEEEEGRCGEERMKRQRVDVAACTVGIESLKRLAWLRAQAAAQ